MIHVHNKVAYSNPFPGLRSFEQEEAYLFFGRENQIRDLNEKLTNSRFLAITHSPDSGTSSLVKAGLIPQLIVDQLGSSSAKKWKVAYFTPRLRQSEIWPGPYTKRSVNRTGLPPIVLRPTRWKH